MSNVNVWYYCSFRWLLCVYVKKNMSLILWSWWMRVWIVANSNVCCIYKNTNECTLTLASKQLNTVHHIETAYFTKAVRGKTVWEPRCNWCADELTATDKEEAEKKRKEAKAKGILPITEITINVLHLANGWHCRYVIDHNTKFTTVICSKQACKDLGYIVRGKDRKRPRAQSASPPPPAQRARANPDTECRSRPNLTRSDGLPELLWSNINFEIKYLCAMED